MDNKDQKNKKEPKKEPQEKTTVVQNDEKNKINSNQTTPEISQGQGKVKEEKKQQKEEETTKDKKEQPAIASVIVKKKRKKNRRQIQKGRVYIKSTYNNTIVTMTDMHGNVLAWSTTGNLGFKGAKKATSYAASQVVADIEMKVQKYGLKELDVFVKGVGTGREAAIRALVQKGFSLNMIKDITPIPHNGCRPRKPRRV